MNMRSIFICLMVALLYGLMGFAIADQAGETTYVPVEIEASPNSTKTVVVERGDHLWKMSAAHLAKVLDKDVANSEISPYWRKTIDANLDSLRSGDPDLIYPGEYVALPAIEQP